MNRILSIVTLFALIACVAPAQQLELNDPGGSLTSNGANPVVGQPRLVSIPQGQTLDFEIGGAPNIPFAVILTPAPVALFSTPVNAGPTSTGEWFDLDVNGNLILLVDGFGGQAALTGIPGGLGFTNPLGSAPYSFPMTLAELGLSVSLQGIVADAGSPPLNLNFTAAEQFDIGSATIITGDDVLGTVGLTSPAILYGGVYSDLEASTNGWMKFSTDCTNSDLSPSATDFLAGTLGGGTAGSAPVICPIWEDIDVGNNASQRLLISEPMPGLLRVAWENADFFPAVALGTVICEIDSNAGTVILDYTGATGATQNNTLVGMSDGGSSLPAALVNEIDLVTAGTVNLFSPLTADPQTIFQNFNGVGAFPGAEDIWGTVITFIDAAPGAGNWVMF